MAFLVKERTNSQYKVTLKDEAGTLITKASVTLLKVTLFNLDDDAQTIINSRNAQDHGPSGLNFAADITMGATDGIVTFAMQPADNAILGGVPAAIQRYERHRLILDVTASSKRLVFQDEVIVENTEKITT